MIRNLVTLVLDVLLGPECRYGCGQRVFPNDVGPHEHLDHAGDPRQP